MTITILQITLYALSNMVFWWLGYRRGWRAAMREWERPQEWR